jgi:hypothetical protein
MPTPNDYTDFRFSTSTGGSLDQITQPPVAPDQSQMTGSYPDAFRSNLISGSETVDRQEVTVRESDPIKLQEQAETSMNAFTSLQTFLMNNLETAGSRVCHKQAEAADTSSVGPGPSPINSDGNY